MPRLLLPLLLVTVGCGGNSSEAPEQAPGPSVETESPTSAPATQVPAKVPAKAEVHPGKAIYDQYCIVCHQADGSGKPPGAERAIAGTFSGPESALGKSDEELLRTIKVGRTGEIGVMPKWMGILNEQKRKDVLAYIRATFGEPASSEASGEAPEGTSPEGS
jgi:mono/diheme cytochrome c family protein